MTTNSDQTTLRYSHDHVFAAMCIWEEICSTTMPEAGEPWEPFREQHGACELREIVIRNLARECDEAWTKAYKFWEDREIEHGASCDELQDDATPSTCCSCGARDQHAKEEPGPFDWKFVPTWLRVAVDWSDLLNGPRVLGT